MDDIGGVWKTIGGRRVFIKEGQDLTTAMKESGKFKKLKNKENDNKKLEDDIKSIQTKINEIENNTNYMYSDEKDDELSELFKKRADLQKSLLDEQAKEDITMIQNKELRDYIYDYTNGDYKIACGYTQYLEDGLSEEESLKNTSYYLNGGIDKISDNELENKIRLAKQLSDEIDKQKETSKLLVRFEKTQMDQDYNDVSKKYKVGEEVNWGIRSTSSNENYFEKVVSGKDKIKGDSLNSAYPFTYTEYHIVGNKKGLDISKYSQYKEQNEVLVKGKFIVKKVENFTPKIVYDEKPLTFKEYIKKNDYNWELRTSRNGNEMLTIYDKDKKKIYDGKISNFVDSIDGHYSYRDRPTLNDILDGKIPYKIEKKENKERSTYGIARQIVTLEQKR